LFVILMVGLAFSASSMAPGHAAGIIFAAGVFMAALLVVLALMRWQGTLLVRLFPRRFQALYHRFVDGAFASFQHLPFVGLLTFLAWGCEIGRLLLVTHAVGVVLPFPGVLVVLSGASLLLTVPTPGGIGAVEVESQLRAQAVAFPKHVKGPGLGVEGAPLTLTSDTPDAP